MVIILFVLDVYIVSSHFVKWYKSACTIYNNFY